MGDTAIDKLPPQANLPENHFLMAPPVRGFDC